MTTPNHTFIVIFPTTTYELETIRENIISNIRFDIEFITGYVNCFGISDFLAYTRTIYSVPTSCYGVSSLMCTANFISSASVVMASSSYATTSSILFDVISQGGTIT
jgi:hypothetical protein